MNFHHDLVKLIREAKYLDKMGFKIPETALNVALQDEKYLNQREQMMVMLNAYKAAVTSLTPVEATVFSEKLKRLRAVLQPGYSPLNWNSLGILEFVEKCKEAINEFASLVTQVKKNGGVIEQVAADISAARVVFDPPVGAETLDATEMFEAPGAAPNRGRGRARQEVPNYRPSAGEDRGGGRGDEHGQVPAARGVLRALGGGARFSTR